jgi:hypothetical protein
MEQSVKQTQQLLLLVVARTLQYQAEKNFGGLPLAVLPNERLSNIYTNTISHIHFG